MTATEPVPHIVRVINSCKHPQQLEHCMRWVQRLEARTIISPDSASKLLFFTRIKRTEVAKLPLDEAALVQ